MSHVERTDLAPDYSISRILKGSWHLAGGHGTIEQSSAIREMYDYLAVGITAFDCADIYTGVEELIGDFRRDARLKGDSEALSKLKVHTKCVPDLEKLATLTKTDVEATIDRSLARLDAERLDLVQFHWWDLKVPRYLEVANWLVEFQKAGKIDLLGTTNFSTAQMDELLRVGFIPATIQLQHSIIDRRPQKKMTEFCAAHGVQMLCYGTVAGGFLSDKWLGQPEPKGPLENRSLTKYKLIIDDIGGWAHFQSLLRLLRSIADKHQVDIASVAMKLMLSEPQVAGIIVGVRHGGHLNKHAKLFELQLDSEDLAQIHSMIASHQVLDGDVYDLERDRTGRHGSIMKYNLNEA